MDTRDTRNFASAPAGHDFRHDPDDVRDVRTASERAAMRERDGRSLGELIKELRDESATLLRQEVALAKTEIGEKAAKAARNGAYVGVGAVLAYLGLFFALAAAAVGLSMALDAAGLDRHAWWLGPLIVGAVIGLVGWAVIQKGLKTLKNESMVPEKTVQSLQEDKQWLQEKVSK